MTILGTNGNDTILPDFVSPGVSGGRPYIGDDTVAAADGNDLVAGILGRDSIDGGDGADTLFGGEDNDTVSGGAGADRLDGGDGSFDWLSYRDDTAGVTVDLAARTASGGHATGDTLLGFEALLGGSGDDVLGGTARTEIPFSPGFAGPFLLQYIDGGAGRDLLRGQGFFTWQRGGAGTDTLLGARGDTLEGGAGADSILGASMAGAAYEGSTVGVTVDLSQTDSITGVVFARGGDAEGDTLVGIANVYGSLLADLLTGDGGPNNLRGRDGDDTLAGGAGDDTLEGGLGRNLHLAGPGDDSLRSRENIDTLYGGEGDDTFAGGGLVFGEAGDDVLLLGGSVLAAQTAHGGDGNDRLFGPGYDDRLDGGDGNDTIDAGAGHDTILGGADADLLQGGEGNDSMLGGADRDMIEGGQGDDLLDGGEGNDRIFGGAGHNTVLGGGGADVLVGGDGADSMLGGVGNDTINASAGDNTILGGADADLLLGGAGADSILGGAGNDTIVGWQATDRLDGGAGRDWLDLRDEAQGVAVALDDAAVLGIEAIAGGSGADLLAGSAGDDTLLGGGGADTLRGGMSGRDSLSGGDGDDSLVAEEGVTTLDGGAGADWLDGGMSGAWLDYRADTVGVTVNPLGAVGRGGLAEGDRVVGIIVGVLGGSGADRLESWEPHTSLDGGAGDDTLSNGNRDFLGRYSNVNMFGGAGDDDYVVRNRYDLVVEDAGEGVDRILTTLAALHLPDHVERLSAMGAGARRLVGNDLDNTIAGGAGDDTLSGGAGDDDLLGGRGADRMWGGAGDDRFRVDNAGDVVLETAGGGRDAIYATLAVLELPLHVEVLYGMSGAASRLSGNGLDNFIRGGGGADTLWGGAGADTLDGGWDTDLLAGGAGDDLYRIFGDDRVREAAGQGQDTVVAFNAPLAVLPAHVEVLVLEGGAAAAGTGNAADNILVGQNGTNLLRGLGGRDSLWGGGGADTLVGGAGADTLAGGAQGDRFRLEAVTDSTPEAADLVADFRFAEGDRVDLSRIDANRLLAGNQAFAWIGAAEFAGGGAAGAGQWRVVATGPGAWRGEGDTDGDGAADVAIDIAAATAALEGWFLL